MALSSNLQLTFGNADMTPVSSEQDPFHLEYFRLVRTLKIDAATTWRTNHWLLAGYLTECLKRLPAGRRGVWHSRLMPQPYLPLTELLQVHWGQSFSLAAWTSLLKKRFLQWEEVVRQPPTKTVERLVAKWLETITAVHTETGGWRRDNYRGVGIAPAAYFESWWTRFQAAWRIAVQLWSGGYGDISSRAWHGVRSLMQPRRGQPRTGGPAPYPVKSKDAARDLYRLHFRTPSLPLYNHQAGGGVEFLIDGRRWKTSDVVGVASGILDAGVPERLPILGDALMDAGCENETILGYCRQGEDANPVRRPPALNWLTAWLLLPEPEVEADE